MAPASAHFREAGTGPSVLCLHASASSSAQWRALAAAMGTVKAEWQAAFTEPTPLSIFSALEVPVLLLTGSESPASSRGVARLLTKSLPRVTPIEIDGVGHMGPVTHPDRINPVIESYLEQASVPV